MTLFRRLEKMPVRRSWFAWLQYLAVAAVIGVAVWARWPARPSPFLWSDEAWRAYYVSITGGPLSFLAFMRETAEMLLASEWLQAKLSLLFFGSSPFGFRIWPLLFSVAAVAGALAVMVRAGQRELALLPALTIALALGFVYHGREFKPYAMDLALTLWTLWAALRAVEVRRYGILLLMLMLLASSTLVFVFVYPAVGCFILYHSRPVKTEWLRRWLFLLPGVLFLLVYGLFLNQQGAGGTMAFWDANYLTSVASTKQLVCKYPVYVRAYTLSGWIIPTVLYFLVLPVVSVRRRDGRWILLLAPFGVLLLASAARVYPLFDRPSFFWYGMLAVGAALALGTLVDGISRSRRQAAVVKLAVVLLALLPLAWAGEFRANLRLARAWPPDTSRRSMAMLADAYSEGDRLYLNSSVYFPFLFHREAVFPVGHPLREMPPPPLNGLLRDWDEATLRQSLSGIAGQEEAGMRLWFMSGYYEHTHVVYQSVLRPLGDPQVLVAEPFQSLVRIDLEHPVSNLATP